MWLWIIGGIVFIVVCVMLYIYRTVQKRMKPEPLVGIPSPPPSNLIGHVYEMMHPLRHEFRVDICDRAKGAGVHQLTMMKHVSVFINDCHEVARVLLDFKEKGPLIASFRLDAKVPDLYTSDGADWEVRHKAFTPALVFSYNKVGDVTKHLLNFLQRSSESGKPIDMMRVFTLLAFDVVCRAVFQYELGAVAGSDEGRRLADALDSMATAQASVGYFPKAGVRKVPPEELQEAKSTWRGFLAKLMGVIRTDAQQYEAQHGALDPRVFGHALYKLSSEDKSFSEEHVRAEVHQVLRHGHECIAGQLTWIFVALHRNIKVRRNLEDALDQHLASASTSPAPPEYLEAVLKETLRRYPVVGNATVRTVMQGDAVLMDVYPVPAGTLLHLHLWSLHNTANSWLKPKSFVPERWLHAGKEKEKEADDAEQEEGVASEGPGVCPRFRCHPELQGPEFTQYDGVGFEEGALSYLPFSTGDRACPGKLLSLAVLRAVVAAVVPKFRLDPEANYWEEDRGNSANATIVPNDPRSVSVVVTRRVPGMKEVKKDEGWADEEEEDEDDEEVPELAD